MRVAAFWLAWLAVAACGTSRVVQRSASGGTIALSGLQYQARSEANDLMRAQCGGLYTVVAETVDRVQFVCGRVFGVPDSQYAPPSLPLNSIPNASAIGLH
jgi:hypothetical protein